MNKKRLLYVLLPVCVMGVSNCAKQEFYSDGKITNSNFEENLDGWNIQGDEVSVANDIFFEGAGSLKVGASGKYTTKISQKIKNLKPGCYYLEIKTQNEGNQDYCYISASGTAQESKKTAVPRSFSKNQWSTVTIRGIKVEEDGLAEIEISDSGNNQFCYFDDIKLIYEKNQNRQYQSLFGGAISWLDWEEDKGAKYYDFDGNQKDALEILKENGCNFVRLEVYNNPGKYKDSNGDYFPEGYKDRDAISDLAVRAHKLDMEIELSFMYSDYWGNDVIPFDWNEKIKNLSSFDEKVEILNNSLYEFTSSFMNRLKDANIYPKYVSLGNEIDSGFLLPYGAASESKEQLDALGKFIKSGYRAVKEASPNSEIVLHLGANANDMHWENKRGSGKYFFELMTNNNILFDVIGTSFYPFWAQTDNSYAVKKKLDLNDLKEWCEMMIDTFDKDVLIMESGYNWGTPGQLANNGAYQNIYPSSPEGQRDYVLDLINTIKSVKDGRCVGGLYWDPILVKQEGIGYALYGNGKARPNVVETTTFFDYDHKALPVLKAFLYN